MQAYRKAALGKRGRETTARFEHQLADHLLELQEELRTHRYQPGPYFNFYIHEPKQRLISAAPFRDRVVHHALCNVIEPWFERRFIYDSYANRIGKGTHRALDRLQQFSRRYRYVLRLDIVKHFPSLDHAVLREILARVIKDDDVLWLVDTILDSGAGVLDGEYIMAWFPGDDLLSVLRPRGLPIGNLTSQFWSNCYLDPFDHFVKRELRCQGYLRYVDDLALFSDSKRELWRWKQAIVEQLSSLRLKLHDNVQVAPVSNGIPWLAQRWAERYPALPTLDSLLRAKRLTLLLDALNEIPRTDDEPIRIWKDFLLELNRNTPGNRVIFSCRSLDYSAPLSSKDLAVPQVRIEPLSDAQVRRFVELYCAQHSEILWQNLEGSPQLELLRSPYFLKLLVDQTTEGEIPEGRAALFTGFVRRALRREVEADNPLFAADVLLSKRGIRKLIHWRWRTPWELPSRGILFERLSTLAYEMQAQRDETETAQIRIGYDEALDVLNHERDEDLLHAGEALGVLEEDLGRDEVLYVHQLLQEYFAARRFAAIPEPQLVQVEWRAAKVSSNLDETLAAIADSDPLPLLPGTGWEETAVLAAAMVDHADTFIGGLMDLNLL